MSCFPKPHVSSWRLLCRIDSARQRRKRKADWTPSGERGAGNWEEVLFITQTHPVSWQFRRICVLSYIMWALFFPLIAVVLLFWFSSLLLTHAYSCRTVSTLPSPVSLRHTQNLTPIRRHHAESDGLWHLSHRLPECTAEKPNTSRELWFILSTPRCPILDSSTIHPFHLSVWQKQQKNESPCLKELKHFIQWNTWI